MSDTPKQDETGTFRLDETLTGANTNQAQNREEDNCWMPDELVEEFRVVFGMEPNQNDIDYEGGLGGCVALTYPNDVYCHVCYVNDEITVYLGTYNLPYKSGQFADLVDAVETGDDSKYHGTDEDETEDVVLPDEIWPKMKMMGKMTRALLQEGYKVTAEPSTPPSCCSGYELLYKKKGIPKGQTRAELQRVKAIFDM